MTVAVTTDPSVTVTGTSGPTRRAGEDATRASSIDITDIERTGRCGRYEVLGQLGAGGMGIVLEARDPALGRKVALKLLRPRRNRTAAESAAQLAVEAQAMARLAHPNVVTVFEIDRVGDQVYVAMELVAGTTLRGWLRDRPRRWREIVELFVGMGRGLAAAHAARLVHRDFKPDNVLIGSDGRPRVCDFGLVVETTGDDAALASVAERDPEATSHGSTVGTPAYMSAEQWTGETVDARSDQFAFCVALWEALCDQRPFAGSRAQDIRAAVCAGTITEPSSGRRVPRWLLTMVRRGLAVDPRARWPDMTTLLDGLERRTRAGRRWTIAAITAGIAIASAAAAAAVVGARDAPDPCPPPTARLAAVWSLGRGEALRAHLAAVDPAQGAARFVRIAPALEVATRDFRAMHVAACRATRVDGRQSDTLLERRTDCLDRWLVELDATIEVIAQAASPAAVDQAVRAATSLSSLDGCADLHTLAEAPPPVTAADRAAAIALANRTRVLDVAQRAGRLDGLPGKAAELAAAARALGHAPTTAGALAVQARILAATGDARAAEPILRELVQVAARVHDDRDEAFAWTALVTAIAAATGKLDEALALVPSARAAIARAGDPIDLAADLLYHQAVLLERRPGPAFAACALLDDARTLLEGAGASSAGSPLAGRLASVLRELGTCHALDGHHAAAISADRQSIARWRELLGPDSPDEAIGLHDLSCVLRQAGQLDEATAAAGEAARIRKARLGDAATNLRCDVPVH